jgi:uncharacterized membrane protein
MKNFTHFLKTTVVGGVFYLVPLIVLIFVLGKAQEITSQMVTPLAARIPLAAVGGIALAKLLAVTVIVFFCFLAGLFAMTDVAKRFVDWLESALLSNLPGYAFIKGMGESMAGVEKGQRHEVLLARIEDAWQIAFLVERLDGGHVAVFVPGAPSPWSGSVFVMTEDRIKPLDLPLKAALNCISRLGVGSNEVLRGRL